MKIYVGNLPWSVDDAELEGMFTAYGAVESAKVINDRETGRSRGFGFVEMGQENGEKAIAELNGQDMGGRALRVNEANDRPPRRGGPGGGGGGGGGGRRF